MQAKAICSVFALVATFTFAAPIASKTSASPAHPSPTLGAATKSAIAEAMDHPLGPQRYSGSDAFDDFDDDVPEGANVPDWEA
ncbi:MAG: hypothetical protein MMC23_001645 [Stictis urceolatum]|nr:hypothetical protein [Stictis urceolata]